MEKFVKYTGLVAPLDRANVDTDQIIPKQFLKSIKRTGFGPNLFDEWRYLDEGFPGQRKAPEKPGLRAQQAAVSGRQRVAHAPQLRLRFKPRARPLGADGFRLPGDHRAQLCGYFLQ